MRSALLLALVLLPWAGCVTPGPADLPGTMAFGRLFAFEPVARGDPTPRPVSDCATLLDTLNQRALEHSRVLLEQSVEHGGWGHYAYRSFESATTVALTAADSSGGAPASSSAQVTGTNNQEAAADEADIVKTDGEWTYVLQGDTLRILRSPRVGDLELFHEMRLPDTWGGTLLLDRGLADDPADDRLVLIVQKSSPQKDDASTAGSPDARIASSSLVYPGHWSSETHVQVYSLADRTDPLLLKDLAVEGSPIGARLVDGVVHTVAYSYEPGLGLETGVWMDEASLLRHGLDWDGYYQEIDEPQRKAMMAELARAADARNVERIAKATLADHIPEVARDGEPARLPGDCSDMLVVDGSKGRGVTTILSLDVASLADDALQMPGASQVMYASGDALVLTAPTQDSWWYWVQPQLMEATDLHWFRLDGLAVSHVASGRVDGTVLDSFSLDVHDGRLRVATTTGQWGRGWVDDPEPMMSHLAVFDAVGGQLVLAGMVGGLAPGERIWSARFTDERAYIVTFRQTDPLWVIDLTGLQPKVLGELHIPGVSTYLHPLAGDLLLAVGIGPMGEEGLDWSRIQVSLFDVSDPAAPRRADVLDVAPKSGEHAWSSAVDEHKAFTYWDALGKLALPVNVGGRASVQLIDVDREAARLHPAGSITQATIEPEQGWNAVERTWFLGIPGTDDVSLYALGQVGATAHDLATLELQAAVPFPQDYGYGYGPGVVLID